MSMDILPILSTLRRHRTTAMLVVLEIALTCAIVCNAVFMIRERLDWIHTPSGIAESQVIEVATATIGKDSDLHGRVTTDLAALRSLPGVEAATLTNQIPFGQFSWNSGIKLDRDQKQSTINATTYYGDDLAHTLGLQFVAGQDFTADDYVWFDDVRRGKARDRLASVIITKQLADRLFPQGALGKTIWYSESALRVKGVVSALVRPSVNDRSMPYASMILPVRMVAGMGASYLLRTRPGQGDHAIEAAVSTLRKLDARRVITQKRTFAVVRNKFFASDRSMAGLLIGVCAALLVVTALGIVGLASFWVGQRRRQIGVRRALGARRSDILRYFQVENFLLATMGIVIGMVLAYGINLLLMKVYEVPRLPWEYLPMGAVLLWLLGQGAVLAPALRAASVPPVEATRG